MFKKCIVVLRKLKQLPIAKDAVYVGVDEGALYLAMQKIPMELAIGDFDSISETTIPQIEPFTKEFIHLNTIKDDSDSEHTINELIRRGYNQIEVYGGLGGRIDHEFVNMRLALRYPNKVTFINDTHRLYALAQGTYTIPNTHHYLSLFSKGDSILSITGTKYELDHQEMKEDDLYGLSNEIIEEAKLTIHQGLLLVIQSNDENKK